MKRNLSALRCLMSTMALTLALGFVSFAQQAAGGQAAAQPAPKPQEYPSTRIDGLVKEWTRARDYTKEYLDAMPEAGTSFKPTPDVRSFAEQMLHLAGGNYGLTARALGVTNPFQGKNPAEMEEMKAKAPLTKFVLDSYDFVIASLKATADAKLDERIALVGFNRPRSAVLAAGFEHQTHHRGQTTIYLRLKGVQPPTEKLF